MRGYDDWKNAPPDDEPAPGEHRPYDDECDCDECSRDGYDEMDGDSLPYEDEDVARGESDYEDCP